MPFTYLNSGAVVRSSDGLTLSTAAGLAASGMMMIVCVMAPVDMSTVETDCGMGM